MFRAAEPPYLAGRRTVVIQKPPESPAVFWRTGVAVVPGFLSAGTCRALLSSIEQFRRGRSLPVIRRPRHHRPLRYQVIDGACFGAAVPEATGLLARVQTRLEHTCGRPLAPIDDRRAACNINITPPGGQYPWHYDRNPVTALIYLNSVEGGETDLYPNYRIPLPHSRPVALQQILDGMLLAEPVRAVLGHPLSIAPTEGTLVVLRGDRTLHSVRPVEGHRERVNLVLAYDQPGAGHTAPWLDAYLYGSDAEYEEPLLRRPCRDSG